MKAIVAIDFKSLEVKLKSLIFQQVKRSQAHVARQTEMGRVDIERLCRMLLMQ